MVTIADIKEHLEQFDDDMKIVLPIPVSRKLYGDASMFDVREFLNFEPVSLMFSPEVDYWEPDDGTSDRLRIKALSWKNI